MKLGRGGLLMEWGEMGTLWCMHTTRSSGFWSGWSGFQHPLTTLQAAGRCATSSEACRCSLSLRGPTSVPICHLRELKEGAPKRVHGVEIEKPVVYECLCVMCVGRDGCHSDGLSSTPSGAVVAF